jgi:hypothetical protein
MKSKFLILFFLVNALQGYSQYLVYDCLKWKTEMNGKEYGWMDMDESQAFVIDFENELIINTIGKRTYVYHLSEKPNRLESPKKDTQIFFFCKDQEGEMALFVLTLNDYSSVDYHKITRAGVDTLPVTYAVRAK